MTRAGLGVSLLVAIAASADQPAAGQRLAEHVFVISIDGCAPRYLPDLDVPNLRTLCQHGSWTMQARTVDPPLTLPATTSMVTGVAVRLHDVDWDAWEPMRGALRARTIYGEAKRAGLTTAVFIGQEKLRHTFAPWQVDWCEVLGESDSLVMGQAIDHFVAYRYNLYFVQLAQTETAGLRHGWGSDIYLQTVINADALVGSLLTAVAKTGLSGSAAVVVTADHGGHHRSHQTLTDDDMLIPWIVAGRGVTEGYEILDRVDVYDTATVVLELFDLPVPAEWEGRVPYRVLNKRRVQLDGPVGDRLVCG